MIIIKQAERLHKNATACFVRLQADEYDNAIETTCLSDYYYGTENCLNHRIMINYSSIDVDKVIESVNRLLSIL